MVKQLTLFASFFMIILTGLILYRVIAPYSPPKNIEKILTQLVEPQKEELYPMQQMREGVLKDLWVHDEKMGRLHHRIESPRSILTVYSIDKRIKLVEQIIEVKCYVQECVEKGEGHCIQQVRYIESDEGTCHYTDLHFEAPLVFFALFRLSGENLPISFDLKESFLQGVAKHVSLSFLSQKPYFHAEKLKAHVHLQRRV